MSADWPMWFRILWCVFFGAFAVWNAYLVVRNWRQDTARINQMRRRMEAERAAPPAGPMQGGTE